MKATPRTPHGASAFGNHLWRFPFAPSPHACLQKKTVTRHLAMLRHHPTILSCMFGVGRPLRPHFALGPCAQEKGYFRRPNASTHKRRNRPKLSVSGQTLLSSLRGLIRHGVDLSNLRFLKLGEKFQQDLAVPSGLQSNLAFSHGHVECDIP